MDVGLVFYCFHIKLILWLKYINKMEFDMSWYIAVLKKYFVFSGRARRKEYWMFALFNFIIAIVLGVVGGILGTAIIGMLYSLAVLIPGIAVTFRRLHDIGKSGWWLLLLLVPIIGVIVILVFMFLAGEEGDNQYGSNPKLEI